MCIEKRRDDWFWHCTVDQEYEIKQRVSQKILTIIYVSKTKVKGWNRGLKLSNHHDYVPDTANISSSIASCI